LRAKPEPTQLEHLSDAPFLSKLLEFPANVRLDWKVIACYKHSSLFGLINSDKGKKFYNIGTWCQLNKTFFYSSLMLHKTRLVCLYLANHFSLVLCCYYQSQILDSGWKDLPRTNTSLFVKSIIREAKKFCNTDT